MKGDAVSRQVENATVDVLHEFTKARSLPILLGDMSNPEIATGTCLRVGGRFFVSTVAHATAEYRDDQIWIVHARNREAQERIPLLQRFERIADGVDLALLEISADSARISQREFATEGAFGDPPRGPGRHILHIHGYPAQFVSAGELKRQRLRYGGVSFTTLPMSLDDYPERADPSRDVAFAYLESGRRVEDERSLPLPDPGGLSGAGIWSLDPNARGPLLGAHNARWVGIQRAWIRERRIAYGNKTELLRAFLLEHGVLASGSA